MKSNHVRERIAKEAARLMCESGIRDFQLAKRKALQRLRISEQRNLPSNEEIEAAVSEYQRLFRAHSQPQRLAELRPSMPKSLLRSGEALLWGEEILLRNGKGPL